jgi:carbamoyl-phosphate synthase large subunit
MNVLLTSAGRRNYMLEYFRVALDGHGQVFAADSSSDAPALYEADRAFVVPHAAEPGYIGHLLELCRVHQVGLLVSLNDLELPMLARHREQFRREGTIAVVSSPDVVEICFDKWATRRFLLSCGISVPKSYLNLEEAQAALDRHEITSSLVVKPRWGSASIGIMYVEHPAELGPTYRLVRQQLARTVLADASARDLNHAVLIQERLIGQEYGLDVLNDLDGLYVTTFARRKLSMRAGETDRAVTVQSQEFDRLGAAIGRQLRHAGNLDCDLFVAEDRIHVLELNPRFGGGYPFTHAAGANLPAVLLAWATNQALDQRWLQARANVRAAKCERLITVPFE